jgi:hypothetical protein
MATKKQKREAAETRRAEFMAKVKADGLAAQKADHDRQREKEERMDASARRVNQQHRSTLLRNGINPSTGLIFTDTEMEEMERKADTPERRLLFERIQAGRAGLLNEQPPLGGIDDYLVPLEGMTVGDFRDRMDQFYTGMGWNL